MLGTPTLPYPTHPHSHPNSPHSHSRPNPSHPTQPHPTPTTQSHNQTNPPTPPHPLPLPYHTPPNTYPYLTPVLPYIALPCPTLPFRCICRSVQISFGSSVVHFGIFRSVPFRFGPLRSIMM